MENKVLRKLDTLKLKNINPDWVNKDSEVYRFLFKKEIYILAYENLKTTKKTLTDETNNTLLNGFPEKIIEEICLQMKSEQYKFHKAKQFDTKKTSKKLKPIEVSNQTDPIIQEVVRLLLEAIWDNSTNPWFVRSTNKAFFEKNPCFKTICYCFQSGKKAHSALQFIDENFKNSKWVVEGEIEKSYENINHDILIQVLEKRIQPGRFLRLIQKMISAGYLKSTIPITDFKEIAQKNSVFFYLLNIYFYELDSYILKQIKQIEENYNVTRIVAKARNLKYTFKKACLKKCIKTHKLFPTKQSLENVKQAKQEILKVNVFLNKLLPIRIKYIRYADNWLVGIDGSLQIAKQIQSNIEEFLITTLKVNIKKTKIIHLKSKQVFFLKYGIKLETDAKTGKQAKLVNLAPSHCLAGNGKGVINQRLITLPLRGEGRGVNKSRFSQKNTSEKTTEYSLKFKAPITDIIKALYKKNFCKITGFPTSKKSWVVFKDYEIVSNFNYVIKILLTYYSKADNYKSLRNIQHILHYSCAMTLAHKHKTTLSKIFKKCGKFLNVGNNKAKTQTCLTLQNFYKWKKIWRVNTCFENSFIKEL